MQNGLCAEHFGLLCTHSGHQYISICYFHEFCLRSLFLSEMFRPCKFRAPVLLCTLVHCHCACSSKIGSCPFYISIMLFLEPSFFNIVQFLAILGGSYQFQQLKTFFQVQFIISVCQKAKLPGILLKLLGTGFVPVKLFSSIAGFQFWLKISLPVYSWVEFGNVIQEKVNQLVEISIYFLV